LIQTELWRATLKLTRLHEGIPDRLYQVGLGRESVNRRIHIRVSLLEEVSIEP
jgi:hypothetical protein